MRAVFVLLGLLLAVLLPTPAAAVLLLLSCLLPLVLFNGWQGLPGWLGLGVVVALVGQAAAISHWPPLEKTEPFIVTGQVIDLPETEQNTQRFLFRPTVIEGVDGRLPRRIRVTSYNDALRVEAGEAWQLPLRLRRPRGFMNPVRFDYELWLATQKIDATATVILPEQAQRVASARGLHHWRASVSAAIGDAVEPPAGRALLQGLVTGDRREFTDSIWAVLRTTGTGHLLAISGLHVGLLAGFGYWLGRLLWGFLHLPGSRLSWAICCGLGFAASYAALAGFSVPTIRALTMLSLAGVVLLCGARPRGLPILLAAGLGLLIVEPASALMPGAWLSFGAVALILILVRGRRLGALKGLWVLQLGLVVGLAPLTAIFFGTFSPLAIPVNLVVLPVFSLLIVPGALIFSALLWIYSPLGAWGLSLLGAFLQALYELGVALIGYGAAPLELAPSTPWLLGLGLLGVALFMLPAGLPMRGLAPILLSPLLIHSPRPLPPGDALITWLEVGQGNAAVIETHGHTVVIDTGPAWRGGSHAASFTLIPYLQERGIETIDTLIITHADADHRGGLSELNARFEIGNAWVGEPLDQLPFAKPCVAGQRWVYDQVSFEFLAPPSPFAATGNAASCVTALSTAGARVLFTGDIEGIEEYSVAMRAEQPFDIVEAPHHGSRTSSSALFLRKLAPTYVIVSAGYRNSFRMPHTEVVERIACAGSIIYDTGLDGAVSFLLRDGDIIPKGGERQRRARLLNAPARVGRFRDGEEILYHRGFIRPVPAGIQQQLCNK